MTGLAIWLAGCGGGTSGVEPDSVEGAIYADGGLAPLGELVDSGKLASAATVYPGDELARTAGVANSGGVLRIQAPIDGMAWAIWGWRNLDYGSNHPVGVKLELDYPSGKYYIGVPDFSSRSWRISGPYSGLIRDIDTTGLSPLLASPNGITYVAVICYNGATARVETLDLQTGQFTRDGPPLLLWTTAQYYEGSSFDYIYLFWEHSRYHHYRYEVERWEAGQDPELAVVFTEYQDLGSSHEGGPIRYGHFRDAEVVPGRYYQYRVTGVEQNGKRSLPGPIALGYAGPQDEELPLHGRVMFDDYFVAPGIELYLPEAELYSSTDEEGNYCIPGLHPGAYNVWVANPVGLQHGALVLLDGSQTSVPDIMLDLETIPDFNWYWLYPPREVAAVRTGPHRVELSWSEPKYVGSYRVYRSCELQPDDRLEVYSGEQRSVVLENEPAGVLQYRVQSVERWLPYGMRFSPLSLPAKVTVPFQGIAADSIYAIPEKTVAHAGERVRVTVYTNEAANPLQYMNGCRITYESGSTIPRESFNVGAPGGARFDPDGIWLQADCTQGILGMPLNLIVETEIGHGRKCTDFNVTPLGASDVILASGALFNFEIEVYSDVHFSFVGRFRDLQRTYYSCGNSDTFIWHDFYNYGQPGITLIDE